MSDIVGEGMSDNGDLSDIEPGLNQTNRSDDLRTRINAVLAKHYPQTTGYQDELTDWCQCGMPRDHVADAVIAELEADYILVPKGHTIARIRSAEKLGLTGDGE